jgi:hypothetical protein
MDKTPEPEKKSNIANEANIEINGLKGQGKRINKVFQYVEQKPPCDFFFIVFLKY